jgi:pyrimidine deaminase RibD-like protein/SAM-dependent methyltransferase
VRAVSYFIRGAMMPNGEVTTLLMRDAIEEAKKSVPEDEGVHPKVGAILADKNGTILQRAHRGEQPGSHAEYLCLKKAMEAEQPLEDCILFTTMEPCTARGPGKKACSAHILESKVGRVYIGMLDPNPAICGHGETRLRFDTQVERFPSDLVAQIELINKEFIELYKAAHLSKQSLYVKMQIHQIMREYLKRQGVPIDEDLPVDIDLTTEDITRLCESMCVAARKSERDIRQMVQDARAEAFDRKYAERTYDDDGRGLGDYWAQSVRAILAEMGASDFAKRKTVVVGIGNGLEGQELYTTCESLIAVDIGEKSLERAAKILPKANMVKAPAEELKNIPSGSQDIYVSLRTYQSTYFDRTAAIREAYRVVAQGGIMLISVANGFLEQGSIIPGLLIPGTAVVDRNLGFRIADQIRSRLSALKFEEIGIRTSLDEIYVYGRRGR